MMTTVMASGTNKNYIVCPRRLVGRVRTLGREPLVLKWGRRFSSVPRLKIWPGREWSSRGMRLYLHPQVLAALRLQPGMRLNIGYNAFRRTLRLSPVVGILAFYHRSDPTFYGQEPFFRSLVWIARRRGMLVYVFSPADVDWKQGHVHGLVVRSLGGGWVRGTFPLPDVVYNRIQNRSLESQPGAQAALDRFERMDGITLFNRGFLNKWDVHSLLSERPELRRYIPRTEYLEGAATFEAMLANANQLFVKPVDGSLGADIAIVRRDPARSVRAGRRRFGETYSYNYYSDQGLIRGRNLRSPADLWSHMERHLSPRPFIVQEDIGLATYRRRRFDLRVIVQRGRGGRWRVCLMFARVAAGREYRTNVDVGARTMPWRIVLRGAFGRRAALVSRRIFTAVRVIADGFAAAHGSLVGELAIDVGLNRRGEPSLIELNSKPVRHMDRYDLLSGRAPRSLTTLLQYSTSLAGY